MENALGVFQNGYFPPFPAKDMKWFFLTFHSDNLMGFTWGGGGGGKIYENVAPKSFSLVGILTQPLAVC